MKPTHVVFCQIEDGAPTPFFVTSLDAARETVRLIIKESARSAIPIARMQW